MFSGGNDCYLFYLTTKHVFENLCVGGELPGCITPGCGPSRNKLSYQLNFKTRCVSKELLLL